MDNKRKIRNIIISIAVTIAIFILDVLTRREYAAWALYIIPLLFAAPAVTRSNLPLLSLGGTILIVLDFFWSSGEISSLATVNRILGIFTLWAALPLLIRQKLAEEALERSYRELEQRVEDRTAQLRQVNASLITEVAERKRAEESLKKIMEELERSNKELEQFAYAVSHDLQEPLRTVGSYIDLLAEKYKGKLDQKADKFISYAIDGAARMSSLINDLLAYSRVGTRGKQFAPVEMSSVFKKAEGNLNKAIDEGHAVVTSDRLPQVFGDESQLVQLLQNLIGNAIKFRKKDAPPRIHVSAERKGSEWVFGMHDNGIGIEPGFQERVFTIFQRLHTREEYPGTGIGLAICRRIVERHEGRIWVESKPGEGSTFYFTLPGRS